MEDFKTHQKILEMMEYGYSALKQYPKSERYAMVAEIKSIMYTILKLEITAQKKYTKKTTLQDLDIAVALLKSYIRISYDMRFLPLKKYDIWSEKVAEIGRMVGGWIKSQSQPRRK